MEQDECSLCQTAPAPYTVRLAGTKVTTQVCEDCYILLLGDRMACYQLVTIDQDEVLFDIVV